MVEIFICYVILAALVLFYLAPIIWAVMTLIASYIEGHVSKMAKKHLGIDVKYEIQSDVYFPFGWRLYFALIAALYMMFLLIVKG